jgi:beta-glucosidase-like glycosyl hydrolase
MDMGAITEGWSLGESVRLAVEAGTDLVLICHRLKRAAEAAEAVSKIESAAIAPVLERLEALRGKFASPLDFDLERFREVDAEIGELRETVLAKGAGRVDSKASHSPVEDF